MAAGPTPEWERRYRAPVGFLPEWSPSATDRLVYVSTESSVWQVHAVDLASGSRRRVTDHPVGLQDGTPTLDGEGVLWFQDETGSEAGRWFVQPFAGVGYPRHAFALPRPADWRRSGPMVVAVDGRPGCVLRNAGGPLPPPT